MLAMVIAVNVGSLWCCGAVDESGVFTKKKRSPDQGVLSSPSNPQCQCWQSEKSMRCGQRYTVSVFYEEVSTSHPAHAITTLKLGERGGEVGTPTRMSDFFENTGINKDPTIMFGTKHTMCIVTIEKALN